MSESRESFVFYKSFYEALQDLKDKDRLKVYDAICEMALNDNESKLTGIAKTIFTLIKPQVLANSRRYENGKKGGRPKKETTGFENKKTIGYEKEKTIGFENIETKTKPNVNVNVNVNENVNANANVNVEVMKITKCYEENIGMLTPATAEVLFAYLDDLTADMIVKAIKIANNNNKKSTNYIDGILKDWVRKGYKTLADTQKEQQERNRNIDVTETDEERKARILKEMEEYQKNDNARVR